MKRVSTENLTVYEALVERKANLALVGLGYVGMPIAVAFAAKGLNVIGFDLNSAKIELYKKGKDPTKEIGDEAIAATSVAFTSDEKELQRAKFIIVAVPTPVNTDHTPDLTPVESASRIVGRNLTPGAIVVYESTVYPGVTEDVCIPILEHESGLKCGVDFKLAIVRNGLIRGTKCTRFRGFVKLYPVWMKKAVKLSEMYMIL
ncbi:UDP-N-acetyl-D-glucosamine 6-dehydrogenase [Acetatifactor muris]|uniref:UDP-N-acetyl-D-glucosamine 6-dehydrogenase n=1 Tax=Acetatifactor muris TaxID=879566 RepID=A0A2K4ZEJ3_9FIRM|nr:NAD(P)-binding domain-containing protein [Acetatifactor muris]SOY28883.1 UDP-N-acetyl-D-glucosamine 6-dehydrogenase [Acetatifactor muris]